MLRPPYMHRSDGQHLSPEQQPHSNVIGEDGRAVYVLHEDQNPGHAHSRSTCSVLPSSTRRWFDYEPLRRAATFDSPIRTTEDAYLYASEDDATAVCETLLRDLPADDHGSRILHESRLTGLRMSRLLTTCDLELVALRSGKELAAVGQDTWLTTAPASKYAATRQWATAIRAWSPWAAGLTWRSHREPDGFAYIFFGDRCPTGCFEEDDLNLPFPPQVRDLSAGPARLYIEEILASYRVVLMQ